MTAVRTAPVSGRWGGGAGRRAAPTRRIGLNETRARFV